MLKQIKIKADNEPGSLRKYVSLLSGSNVNIKALEVSERGDGEFGHIHLIVSDIGRATSALETGGVKFEVVDVLAVEMDDQVGGLTPILDVLSAGGFNIGHLYAFLGRVAGKSLAVFSVEDLHRAKVLLEDAGMRVICQDAIEEEADKEPFQISPNDHFGKDFIW